MSQSADIWKTLKLLVARITRYTVHKTFELCVIFASRKLNDMYMHVQGWDTLTMKYSEFSVHVIRNVDLSPETVFVFGNFRVHNKLPAALETFATRGKVVADKEKTLFCLVFTVLGNSAISFANVEVNRTPLPVLGKSLHKSLPCLEAVLLFSFLVVEGLVIFQRTVTKFKMPANSVQLSTFVETLRWDWQRC